MGVTYSRVSDTVYNHLKSLTLETIFDPESIIIEVVGDFGEDLA